MIGGKYGAVIGRKIYIFYVPSMNFQAMDSSEPITALYTRIYTRTSHYGISPKDSVTYSD